MNVFDAMDGIQELWSYVTKIMFFLCSPLPRPAICADMRRENTQRRRIITVLFATKVTFNGYLMQWQIQDFPKGGTEPVMGVTLRSDAATFRQIS